MIERLPKLEERFAGSRVNIREATELPLYALFRLCDAHLTGYSTCAMEALAFGRSTVLFHPTGAELYQKQITDGVFEYADEPITINESLERSFHKSTEEVVKQSSGLFQKSEPLNLSSILNAGRK